MFDTGAHMMNTASLLVGADCERVSALMNGMPEFREEVEIRDNLLKAFLAIRAGSAENLSSVEAGLRFARLWDGIKASAAKNGEPVAIRPGPMTPR